MKDIEEHQAYAGRCGIYVVMGGALLA